MPDQPPAGLEEPLLQARERPALDGERQDEPAQEIPQVVGDNPQEQAHLVGPEAVTGEARPVGGGFALNELVATVTTLSLDATTGLLTEVSSASALPADSKLVPGAPRGAVGAPGQAPRDTSNDIW